MTAHAQLSIENGDNRGLNPPISNVSSLLNIENNSYLFVFLEQTLHVLGDVSSDDVFLVDLGVVLFALGVEAGESPVAVRNVDSSVDGALQSAEDLGAGGCAGEADVEVSAEGAVFAVDVLNAEILAVGLGLALVNLVQTVLGRDREEEERREREDERGIEHVNLSILRFFTSGVTAKNLRKTNQGAQE